MSEIDTSKAAVERLADGLRDIGSPSTAATLLALLTRCETAERERDEALVALGEQKLCDCGEDDMCQIVRERDEARARADAAEAAVGVLREALDAAEDLYLQAAPGAWRNGVTDQSGTSDEGEYLAARCFDRIKAALTSTTASAAARDARIRGEGRREGIEEAARAAEAAAFNGDRMECCNLAEECCEEPNFIISHRAAATAIRALLDKPAKGGADE